MRIPLVDLRAQYLRCQSEFDQAVVQCLDRTSFIGGPDHDAFAKEFASYCGGGITVPCGNGTDALSILLVNLLGQGDGTGEIITVSHTFIATVEAIATAGYRPVLVDVDAATYTMDPAAFERAITPRTVAVVPVHLYGQMAAMDRIADIAGRHGLKVVEDAAQAHGAAWQGKGPGQWGAGAGFSFYPGKNLGAWGDGGAALVHDADLAKAMESYCFHGRIDKFRHRVLAVNSRLDGLQAAVLRVKLRHLPTWTEERRRAAGWYGEALAKTCGDRIVLPAVAPDAYHVYHLFVIQVEDRDRVLARLNEQGIGASIHYPVPVHLQPALADRAIAAEDLPVTHRLCGRILSLPIYPEITRDMVDHVATTLGKILQE